MDQPAAAATPAAEPTVSQFPLQASRALRERFAYLAALSRADYYQAIVRVFLKNARRYYRIYLTSEQIADEVARVYGDYSVEKCHADLEQLVSWGNVVRTFDTAQRHTTIDSFLHPTVLYRAAPEALEIEETFLRLEQRSETDGELRRGDLDHLARLFGEVDALVRGREPSAGGDVVESARQDQLLAETWRRLADQAQTILENTSKYIHTLAIVRQEAASTEIEGYIRYKLHVVEYIQSFAIALERVSGQLQRMFRSWEESGAQERIVSALAEHPGSALLELPPLDERMRDALSQLAAVADWFSGPEWTDYFGKAARFEVSAVLHRAQLLATTAHLGASYLVDLETLARRLLGAADAEAASQVLVVAFAHPTPRILPERLAGNTVDTSNPWEGRPAVELTLQPFYRGSSTPPADSTLIRDRESMLAIREAALAHHRDRVARLTRLFGDGDRSVATMPIRGDQDVGIVIEVIRRCVEDVNQRWRADDGSMITLLNPTERRGIVLRGQRGRYVLPCFDFHCVSAETRRPRDRVASA